MSLHHGRYGTDEIINTMPDPKSVESFHNFCEAVEFSIYFIGSCILVLGIIFLIGVIK